MSRCTVYWYGGDRTVTERMYAVARNYDISLLSSTIKNHHNRTTLCARKTIITIYSAILLPELPSSTILESTPKLNQCCLHSACAHRLLNVKNSDMLITFWGYSSKWQKTVTWGEELMNKWCYIVFLVHKKVGYVIFQKLFRKVRAEYQNKLVANQQ